MRVFTPLARLASGWASDVVIEIDAQGTIERIEPSSPRGDAALLAGPVIPGMPNAHSHVFQRAIAGATERRAGSADDFWTWREKMYAVLAAIDPPAFEAIAAATYVDMLRGGYTSVAEFHYLHNDRDGTPYTNRAELAQRVIAAAQTAGIALTLLPVLYQTSDFGGAPPTFGQRRFVMPTDAFLDLIRSLDRSTKDDPLVRIGVAPHSLRAVTPDALAAIVHFVDDYDPRAPIHMHIAEQEREVEACVAWSGRRPIAWLLERFAVDRRWCLVHATHADPDEVRGIAQSGSVASLCPTTEANLGDGVFPMPAYLASGGTFAVGTDSNVALSASDEIRFIEYVQRLVTRRRNVLAHPVGSVGERLYVDATRGGAQALAQPVGSISVGARADLVVLDGDDPLIATAGREELLDTYIFAVGAAAVRDVMVGGRWVIRERVHAQDARITRAYTRALQSLRETLTPDAVSNGLHQA